MHSSETDMQKGKMDSKIPESNRVFKNLTMLSEHRISEFLEKKISSLENTKSKFETTKITNLNTDCMELVFEHLELKDLLNISDSSNQFESAVCRVYKKKYLNMDPTFDQAKFSRLINQSFQYMYIFTSQNLHLIIHLNSN